MVFLGFSIAFCMFTRPGTVSLPGSQGADVAWSDADGLQGLHWAARQGQTAALQVLLEAGANAEGRWEEVAGTVGRKCFFFNVNPGLINHGLLIRGVLLQ